MPSWIRYFLLIPGSCSAILCGYCYYYHVTSYHFPSFYTLSLLQLQEYRRIFLNKQFWYYLSCRWKVSYNTLFPVNFWFPLEMLLAALWVIIFGRLKYINLNDVSVMYLARGIVYAFCLYFGLFVISCNWLYKDTLANKYYNVHNLFFVK